MARSRVALLDRADDDVADIEAWYRAELAQPAVLPVCRWEPVRIGPTWQVEGGRWLLPQVTLGWQVLAWCGRWLQESRGVPWRFTPEQARFVLWWYALRGDGSWLYRDGVLQRLKGWGKDPLGACLCLAELVGPTRVVDWVGGRPVGGDVPEAWVQTAAVSQTQTKNTMRLLPGLLTAEARAEFALDPGEKQAYALDGERFLQAVTSSPATLEGARATKVLLNEPHLWVAANGGHEMAAVIERNATKSSDGSARTLRITNAYEPGEDSVAERDRESWERVQAGDVVDTGLLYDSLEAGPDAPLTADAAPEVVATIRGDATWLSTDRIVASILDTRNPPSRSRRFWYNQIVAAEDAWADPLEWDAIAAPDQLVLPAEPIVAFFDGSKSDDTTGLVGCRLSDGHVFVIDVWSKPAGERGRGWVVDRAAVDSAVSAMFGAYRVQAFFADPSDTRDDDDERFWEPFVDDWHQRYGAQLPTWAVQSGDGRHSIGWDMRSPDRQRLFTAAAERFLAEVKAARFTHDGDRRLRQHVRNARRRPNRWGVGLGKEHRESARKVDLAVCAVGARMLRRLVQNKATGAKQRSGKVW